MRPAELHTWLVERVAAHTGLPPTDVDPTVPLAELGVGSQAVAELAADLSARMGTEVHPALLFEHPTVTQLVAQLTAGAAGGRPTVDRQPDRTPTDGRIAIVGISVRTPGAASPDELWRLLVEGADPIGEVDREGWQSDGTPGSDYAGLLSDIACFDAAFFQIPHEEARRMDPQQRLLLQGAWEAIEDAGLLPERLRGSRTGVYLGISNNEYVRRQVGEVPRAHALTPTANALSTAANRISYLFDLRGPSLAVDTACSSSLVAVHLAVRALRNGECDTAVVGGVNLLLEAETSVALARGGMLSPDGRCHSFDASANGYVRSEGCLVVVLKPLAQALADGDRVYGVILGTAVNQDGRSNGFTAPNPAAQESVLAAAYQDAGVAPADVRYVECHGTGTLLGDPIEARALGTVLGAGRDSEPCLIGSVKSNLGHLEAAAGIAGLVKVALALHKGYLPANLHYRTANPHIDFDRLRLRVIDTGIDWPGADRAVAGVSSFGFGGTNAHVVVAPAPLSAAPAAAKEQVPVAAPLVLPVSARHPAALADAATALADRIARLAATDLPAVVTTATRHRTHHPLRFAAVGSSPDELAAQLRAAGVAVRPGADPAASPLFLFPGQSNQRPAALLALAAQDERIAATLRRCDEVLAELAGWSLLKVLRRTDAEVALQAPDVAQPVAVATQLALAAMWQGFGIRPQAVLGHSLGEVSAAAVAGSLTLAQAMQVALARGQAIAPTLGTGRMLALSIGETDAGTLVRHADGRIELATVNGPESVVLSGDATVLERLRAQHEVAGVVARWIPVEYPSHSTWMSDAATDLGRRLSDLRAAPPQILFWSTVVGGPLAEAPAAEYWASNLRSPVRFEAALGGALDAGVLSVVELGAQPVLRTPVRQVAAARGVESVFVSSMEPETDPVRHVREGLARLYEAGATPRWERFTPHGPRAALPTYPWRRDRHWLPRHPAGQGPSDGGHPLLGRRLDLADAGDRDRWELVLGGEPPAVTAGHVVDGQVVMPASGYVELAVAAGRQLGITGPIEVRDLRFHALLQLDDGPRWIQVVAVPAVGALDRPDPRPGFAVRVLAKAGAAGTWRLFATGTVAAADELETTDDLRQVAAACDQHVSVDAMYSALHANGLEYGPDYRLLSDVSRGTRAAVATLAPGAGPPNGLTVDPRPLDAAFQLIWPAAVLAGGIHPLPVSIDRVRVHDGGSSGTGVRVQRAVAEVDHTDATEAVANVVLLDAHGEVSVSVRGLRLSALTGPAVGRPGVSSPLWRYESVWQHQEWSAEAAPDFGAAWLVVAADPELAAALAPMLRANGGTVHMVRSGDRYTYSEDVATIRPDRPGDWVRLLSDSRLAGPGGLNVVHLGPADEFTPAGATAAVMSLTNLVQALATVGVADRQLWVVTRGACQVEPDDRVVRPAGAGLWGLARVLPFELPLLPTRCVDLPANGEVVDIAGELAAELRAPSLESEVALRGARRYVARIAPLTGVRTPAAGSQVVRPSAAYLVVGGLGALGLRVAQWLAARGAGHIGLLGRRPPTPAAAAVIEELTTSGVRVHLIAADVGDPVAVAESVVKLRSAAPLAGVVVAAGVIDDASLFRMTGEMIERVMRPKVAGAVSVAAAIEADPPDWVVYFSSAASVLGSPGQANYCAANAVLDAIAVNQRSAGLNALTVNWGPWAQAGLAVGAARGTGRMAAAYTGLAPEHGIQALEEILHDRRRQTLVMPTNLNNLVQFFPSELGVARFSEVTTGNQALLRGIGLGSRSSRPPMKHSYVAPRNDVERRIARIWQESLGFTEIGVHDSFFELGGDSVFANQLVLEVGRTFNVPIPSAEAFEHLTIARLADLTEREIHRALANLTEGEAEALLRRAGGSDGSSAEGEEG
ncbi:SDR family NAD(P)-dependent oxidoreductase [Micromonospora sp. NPDC049662]|uniref:SDR family NAD(P)-dependent oxidoreductase n=1 Tax=Micromonospora sp. NPDC049662 TaxID=3155397 RepID=UPI0034331698